MIKSYMKRLSFALLDVITNKDPVVQEQVCSALCSLGEVRPTEMLHTCEEYLKQHDKLAHPYCAMVLRAMETVLTSHIHKLDKDTASTIILLASSEMSMTKEPGCDWQQAASSVLVAVGKRFTNQVMEEVLSRFQPGLLPHCSVLQTLSSLSVSNAFGIVPFLSSILSTMLPTLGMAKQDLMRVMFCCALQHFSESTLEYLANLDQVLDPTVLKQNIHPLLAQQWETTMPPLLEYLDEHTKETLPLKKWEEKLLMFLRETLAVVSDNTWIWQLSLEMCKQLPCYNRTPQEKNFLYKCTGTTLGAAASKGVMEQEGGWELLRTSTGHEEGVTQLASAMAKCTSPRLPLVTKVLLCTQRSIYEIHRVTSTAFLAEVRTYGPQLLTAKINGLDDNDDPHRLVAMVGLTRLLDLMEPWDLRSVLLHMAICIRPFFDSACRFALCMCVPNLECAELATAFQKHLQES
ncbi:HEAT repeat-containing protein 7A [Heterocephalus glaber]|uniref:HEAT repeat-containing protein 7A n=1 Tax=Heterocephalus glaber TaxID=10181 RepID=G5BYH9_HETGA|nr:HEAT repeat-containing protein 7A [Heterocephalus glaber]